MMRLLLLLLLVVVGCTNVNRPFGGYATQGPNGEKLQQDQGLTYYVDGNGERQYLTGE